MKDALLKMCLAVLLFSQCAMASDYQKASFAAGCFWCVEHAFEYKSGIKSVVSGYMGRLETPPTYRQVASGKTPFVEAIQLEYDPEQIKYVDLLEIFWRNVDPVDDGGQFCDRGSQYRPAIFYHSDEQKAQAEASKHAIMMQNKLGPIVVPVEEAAFFHPAEDYHQNYAQRNPIRYQFYRRACGRDKRLQAVSIVFEK